MMQNILNLINNNEWDKAYQYLSNVGNLFGEISDGKNLFHFSCIRGNEDTINKYIKLKNSKIIYSDNDGNNGIHLLSINGWDDILVNLLEYNIDYLKLINNDGKTIISYILNRKETLEKIFILMKKNKLINLFNNLQNQKRTIIMDIIDIIDDDNFDYDDIYMLILRNKNIKWEMPKEIPSFLYLIEKNKINLCLYLLDSKYINFNFISSDQISPLIFASIKNNYEIINKLNNINVDLNYGGQENNYLPINISIKNRSIDIINLFINSNKIDFNKKDNKLNLPLHYMIDFFITEQNHNKSEFKNILNHFVKHTDVYHKNINGISTYDLLKNYNLWENVKHLNNYSPKNYLNNIIMPKIIKTNYGLFNSDTIHNILYMIYIFNKYDNITYPAQFYNDEKQKWEKKYIISHDPFMTNMRSSIKLHHKYFFCLLPSIFYWRDKNIYYKTHNMDFYLKRAIQKTKRFVIIKLSLIPQVSSMHANIVIYDKNKNKIIRFEPYGDWEIIDSYNLDKMICNMFCRASGNKKVIYLKPGDYLSNPKFQTASGGDFKKNLGDPIGYCLAWCYWFIELKLENPDEDEKQLVEIALENIIINKTNNNDQNLLLGYIRGYGRKLDNEKNKILIELGLKESEIYDLTYSQEKLYKISNYINDIVINKILN
jgi:hypothetical protein